MDEPLSDLDANLKVDIRKEIQNVHRRVERPTLYVTHDQEEAMTMSDRIAVMNDGKVEQVGTPNDLYYEPRNRFVATFIGNPNMNFAPGTISEVDEDKAQIEIGDFTAEVNVELSEKVVAEHDVIVGFRPECINIGDRIDETQFEAEVVLIEQIGDQLMVTMDGPFGEEIRAITPAANRPEVNQMVPFSLDLGRLHLFDPQTDEAIANTK
jgi:multiple sugar transport system ATP-binding protein